MVTSKTAKNNIGIHNRCVSKHASVESTKRFIFATFFFLPRADRFALVFLSLKRIHFGIVVFVFSSHMLTHACLILCRGFSSEY